MCQAFLKKSIQPVSLSPGFTFQMAYQIVSLADGGNEKLKSIGKLFCFDFSTSGMEVRFSQMLGQGIHL